MALFTLNLKQIFRHMDATFPKYAVRAFGCSAPFGTIYAINPALIIVGVPVVAAATAGRRHFDVIFRGAWITAAAPFIVAASQTYAGAVAFVVVLSLGEMLWSPRWYDYTMAMAPAGKEGVFGAMALAPLRGGYPRGPGRVPPAAILSRSAGTGRGLSRGGRRGGERRRGGRRRARVRRPIDVGDHRRGDDDVAAAHRRVPPVAQRLGRRGRRGGGGRREGGRGGKGGAAGRYTNLDREGEFDEDDPELELMPLEPTPIGSRQS